MAENRSEWASIAAALAAPLLLWCCGASWLWILAGGIAAVGLYAMICHFQPEENLADVTRRVFGRRLGTGILWLQAIGLAFGAGYLLRATDPIVPNLQNGYPWIPVVLCALALAGAWRGRKAALASGAVLFWLTVITVIVVTVFSVPQMRLRWLAPEGSAAQLLPALAVFLLPIIPLYSRKPEGKRNAAWLHLGLVLASAVVVLVTSACLSPRLASDVTLPFFDLAASCRLLGHAARFDAVFCMTVSAALYCLLIIMLNFCHCLTVSAKRWPMIILIVLALGASYIAPVEPYLLAVAYLAVVWVIFPVFSTVFYRRKKPEKKAKKDVDKRGRRW